MKHSTITILTLLFCTTVGLGDGKMYVPREHVPLDIPYQRALILHQNGQEAMVLQSKFETSETLPADSSFGWVVPLPCVPELASMDAREADMLFFRLSWASHPSVTVISNFVLPTVLATLSLLTILCYLSFINIPWLNSIRKHRETLLIITLFSLIFAGVLLPALGSAMRGAGGGGVEVLQSGQVGIYDTKVIRSDSSAALIAWLNENGFEFTPSDAPVVESYIKQGWCFVVAKVRPGEDMEFHSGEGGLVDPLILRFKSENAVYPLALTATIGVDTEVLLYVMSDRKMQCGGRMKLLFAGDMYEDFLRNIMGRTEHFRPWEESLRYLCKFKSTLTPEEMKTDLVFTPAEDNEDYREHIIKW